MAFAWIGNIIVFIALLWGISAFFRRRPNSLAVKVFSALVLGALFGLGLQLIYGPAGPIMTQTLSWVNIVGAGYILLLQMIIVPLVFASILSAVARLHNTSSLGKISALTIGLLVLTTGIAAFIGAVFAALFGLKASQLVQGAAETAQLQLLQSHYAGQLADLTVPQLLLSFIPANPGAALAQATPTAIIAVVIFAAFLGAAALRLAGEDAENGAKLLAAINVLRLWVMKLARLVISLTPYGVLALMAKMAAVSDAHAIWKLGLFIIASYCALAVMFALHAALLALAGINPLRYYRKVFPVLSFAFAGRSGAAAIPLNIEAQTKRLGVPAAVAGFAASFGATIGQNGCAGVYPAMLAAMVAPTMGINPLDPAWLATLIGIVALSSFGVAGVGGGATFAALIVLPAMGLPVTLVALLISVEPLIDMGRTALNVNGAMTAGAITARLLGQWDKNIFAAADEELTEK